MGLLMEERIEVRRSGDLPEVIILRGKQLRVAEVLDVWRDVGRWWLGEREKTFYRLAVERGGVLEVYHPSGEDTWVLYRVYD
ncbi:MAG: DUF6504 family protein [Bacillota bacterium]